ncbi:replicative DNA helicase [Larkinella arboricola]|uniref:DNA 5'-3' helicase n=1 Tax=Larkinella arboricola TaxID=643671 RepID=A0A327WST5_LARAB|nr:DnaB-like helicase C-terminal domain-containing protein [Larkinella arboricola]RAJ95420.1 replicative DNA helicase [Larkinella arboricola]
MKSLPQLPQDETTERAVVAALLAMPKLFNDYWAILLQGEVFTHEGYRLVVQTMHTLYVSGQKVRLASILKALKQSGNFKRLAQSGIELEGLDVEGQVLESQQDCYHLRELWIKRESILGAQSILTAAYSGGESVDVLSTKANQLADQIGSGMNISREKSTKHYIASALKRIEAAMKKPNGTPGVDTGLKKLNNHFGGWQNGIILIAGRPGMGKTIVGLFAALSAARAGTPVGYISLEVDAEELLIRAFAEGMMIPYEDILNGKITQQQFGQIHKLAGEMEQLPIHFYDEEPRDIEDVRNLLIDWRRRHRIELAIIDYVQLIEDRTQRGEYEVASQVSKKLKKVQRRLKIPIIELSQLNRENEKKEDKRPQISGLRSTGQLEQDASVVILLYRDDYYKLQQAQERGEEVVLDYQLELIVCKNRNGRVGTAYIYVDAATNRLVDYRNQLDLGQQPEGSFQYQPVEKADF